MTRARLTAVVWSLAGILAVAPLDGQRYGGGGASGAWIPEPQPAMCIGGCKGGVRSYGHNFYVRQSLGGGETIEAHGWVADGYELRVGFEEVP